MESEVEGGGSIEIADGKCTGEGDGEREVEQGERIEIAD